VSRRTIAHAASISGVGLHLGVPCRLEFRPAPVDSGVAFLRTDIPGAPPIPAHASRAVLTDRRTQLGEGEGAVHTVEHVLAAVAGAGIDDLLVAIDGPEPPIMDGSAAEFLACLRGAGVRELGGTVRHLELRAPLTVEEGESRYTAHPADALELEVHIDFPHPLIGRQRGQYTVTEATFARELASARTFGFLREVAALRAMGLIQGASTENAVVLDESGLVDATLRWPDEFVRHKAMDCVGDLALAGARIRARIVAEKPSHRGTIQFVRALLAATTQPAKEMTRVLGIQEIMEVLPHRYPFLLVDRILELEPQKRVVGIKNVTINEPFFQGHFPGHPIMPGVLIVEAMAQVGGMLLLGAVPDPQSKVVYFTSLDSVRWRRPVRPGDQLRFVLEVVQVRGMMCKMKGVATVDGELVCEADLGAAVRDR